MPEEVKDEKFVSFQPFFGYFLVLIFFKNRGNIKYKKIKLFNNLKS